MVTYSVSVEFFQYDQVDFVSMFTHLDMTQDYCHGWGNFLLRVGVQHCGYHFGIRPQTGTV